MAKAWKILALLLAVTALVWLSTMWHWQSAQIEPSSADLVLKLGLLPLALTAALVLAIWSTLRLRAYAAAPPAPAAAPASPATPARSDEAERGLQALVLAGAAHLRVPGEWAGAQAAIEAGECAPGLDPRFKNDDGVAVFTAPIDGVVVDDVAEAVVDVLTALRISQPNMWIGYEAPAELLRSLALLKQALSSVEEVLRTQWPALALPPAHRAAADVSPPCVSIHVAIPARWLPLSQQMAQAWIGALLDPLVYEALAAAGQSRALADDAACPAAQWQVHVHDSAEQLWPLLDRQLVQWHRERQPGLLLALAADSLIDERQVARMASARELFSGTCPHGRVPGEGAAALLLATPDWPAPSGTQPLARLHRPGLVRRERSADAQSRADPQALHRAASAALQAAATPGPQVADVTTDADHRSSRSGELFEALAELLPDLDTGEHLLRLGAGCGDIGLARLLACTALAAVQVQQAGKPALVLGVFHPLDRFAALMVPQGSPSSAEAPRPA